MSFSVSIRFYTNNHQNQKQPMMISQNLQLKPNLCMLEIGKYQSRNMLGSWYAKSFSQHSNQTENVKRCRNQPKTVLWR